MQQQQEQDFTKRFDAGLWVRLVRYLKPYHKSLLLIIVMMAGSAICDTIFPLMNREAIDGLAANGYMSGVAGFAVRYFGVVVFQTLCIFAFCRTCSRTENGINRHIRSMGFKRLQELSFSYYDKMPVGFIISRMTSDTARLGETIAWGLVDLFWSFFYKNRTLRNSWGIINQLISSCN